MAVGRLGNAYLYDYLVREEFSEQIWGHWPDGGTSLRVLVVNPLGNWWSYAFSIEAALRLREEGHDVRFLDLAAGQTGELEVNPGDRRSTWRFRQPQSRIVSLLEKHGVHWIGSGYDQYRDEASWFPSSLDDLRSWHVDRRPAGKIVAAAISGVLHERDFVPSDHTQLVNRHIAAYKFGSHALRSHIVDLSPDLVVTTNDRLLMAATALSEAREHGIDSLVIYWGNTNRKCVTYRHSLYDASDWRSHIRGAWNSPVSSQQHLEAAKSVLRAAGDRGLPATASFRSLMGTEDLPRLPPDKKVLTFFPTTPWEYSGLVERPEGHFEDQVEAVLALLEEMDSDEWILVVRHHPPREGQPVQAEPAIWNGIRGHQSLIEIPADSGVDSYKLMDSSTLVAVWVSTIGAEAIARGKPVMVLGEPYWLDHDWGISAPTREDIAEVLTKRKIIEPEALLPYLCYFNAYGSPLRHVAGIGFEGLKVHNERVFSRTIAGVAFGWLRRWLT